MEDKTLQKLELFVSYFSVCFISLFVGLYFGFKIGSKGEEFIFLYLGVSLIIVGLGFLVLSVLVLYHFYRTYWDWVMDSCWEVVKSSAALTLGFDLADCVVFTYVGRRTFAIVNPSGEALFYMRPRGKRMLHNTTISLSKDFKDRYVYDVQAAKFLHVDP